MKKYFHNAGAILALPVFLFPLSASASTGEQGLEFIMGALALKLVFFGLALTALFLLIAILITNKSETLKRILFDLIIIAATVPTLVLIYNTVYINSNSWSKGPVHWHADYEIWVCGRQLDLVDPVGWSNKIGSPTFHEHSDNRLHFEGVALTSREATLERFFALIGGKITDSSLIFPDKDGLVTVTNESICRDGTSGSLQTYVYQVNPDNTFTQKKIHFPGAYILSPYSQVPPGDCIIIEFAPVSPTTNRICRSWEVAQSTGKLKGEVGRYGF